MSSLLSRLKMGARKWLKLPRKQVFLMHSTRLHLQNQQGQVELERAVLLHESGNRQYPIGKYISGFRLCVSFP